MHEGEAPAPHGGLRAVEKTSRVQGGALGLVRVRASRRRASRPTTSAARRVTATCSPPRLENVAILSLPACPRTSTATGSTPGAPTVLVYGHTTSSARAGEKWTSPPFLPVEKKGGSTRGTADDKGLLAWVAAASAYLRSAGRSPSTSSPDRGRGGGGLAEPARLLERTVRSSTRTSSSSRHHNFATGVPASPGSSASRPGGRRSDVPRPAVHSGDFGGAVPDP